MSEDPREREQDAIALDAAADLVEAQLADAATAEARVAWSRMYARLLRLRSDLLRGPTVLWVERRTG